MDSARGGRVSWGRPACVREAESPGAGQPAWGKQTAGQPACVGEAGRGGRLPRGWAGPSARRERGPVGRPSAPRERGPVGKPSTPRERGPVGSPSTPRKRGPVGSPSTPRKRGPVGKPSTPRKRGPVGSPSTPRKRGPVGNPSARGASRKGAGQGERVGTPGGELLPDDHSAGTTWTREVRSPPLPRRSPVTTGARLAPGTRIREDSDSPQPRAGRAKARPGRVRSGPSYCVGATVLRRCDAQ